MVGSLGVIFGGSAAIAVAASIAGYVRVQLRAARMHRRHIDFAERFKQSGFVEYPAWDDLDTLPMQLQPPA